MRNVMLDNIIEDQRSPEGMETEVKVDNDNQLNDNEYFQMQTMKKTGSKR